MKRDVVFGKWIRAIDRCAALQVACDSRLVEINRKVMPVAVAVAVGRVCCVCESDFVIGWMVQALGEAVKIAADRQLGVFDPRFRTHWLESIRGLDQTQQQIAVSEANGREPSPYSTQTHIDLELSDYFAGTDPVMPVSPCTLMWRYELDQIEENGAGPSAAAPYLFSRDVVEALRFNAGLTNPQLAADLRNWRDKEKKEKKNAMNAIDSATCSGNNNRRSSSRRRRRRQQKRRKRPTNKNLSSLSLSLRSPRARHVSSLCPLSVPRFRHFMSCAVKTAVKLFAPQRCLMKWCAPCIKLRFRINNNRKNNHQSSHQSARKQTLSL